jgi:hypothetical protein
MLEELLDHKDDRRSSARRHSLPGAPGVDFLDQLGSTPMSIFAVLRFMPLRWGVAVLLCLIIRAKTLMTRANPSEIAVPARFR